MRDLDEPAFPKGEATLTPAAFRRLSTKGFVNRSALLCLP
jgi:hypothetical protein